MGFQGYIEILESLHEKTKRSVINKAEYHSDIKINIENVDISGNESEEKINDCVIKNQYYPLHMYESDCVKNDVILDSCSIITGPNASGKTTYLKSTAINVILSQQIGFGFYDSCLMYPYSNIHSYLNIPDTSGRDSLFQSESRRCKTILDSIRKSDVSDRHFCIFDELYSGTNPNEATKSAHGFIEYIRRYENVDLFLTTHYVSICDKLIKDKNKKDVNKLMMVVNTEDGVYTPKYKITEGVSKIEGAIEILKEMDYPQEIIDSIKESVDENESVIEPVKEDEDDGEDLD
jgi:DNA mismatch repair ATPase MutS